MEDFLSQTVPCATGTATAVPAGSAQNQVQTRNADGSALAYSKATLDTPGNALLTSVNGTKDAALNQTGTNTGDGIAASLTTNDSLVKASPSYQNAEAQQLAVFRQNGLGSPSYADNTYLLDQRIGVTSDGGGTYGAPGVYAHNPTINRPYAYSFDFHRDSITQASGAGPAYGGLGLYMTETYGGKNYTGSWSSTSPFLMSLDSRTKGIKNGVTTSLTHYGSGDTHPLQSLLVSALDARLGADEGGAVYRGQITSAALLHGTCSSGCTAGSQRVQIAPTANPNGFGEDLTLIDTTASPLSVHITAIAAPSGSTYGTYTTTETLTPATGTALADNGFAYSQVPLQFGGATTTVSASVVTTSGLLTTGPVCVADPASGIEQGTITSASAIGKTYSGRQDITITLRTPHESTYTTLMQGGSKSCGAASLDADAVNGDRTIVRIIGAVDAHTLAYAQSKAGYWVTPPTAYFSTTAGANTATIYSAALITQATDPTSKAMNNDPTLEVNTIPFASGDALEVVHGYEFYNAKHESIYLNNPLDVIANYMFVNTVAPNYVHDKVETSETPSHFAWDPVNPANNVGKKVIGGIWRQNLNVPFKYLDYSTVPPGPGGAARYIGCNPTLGCSSANGAYVVDYLTGAGGSGASGLTTKFDPSTSNFSIISASSGSAASTAIFSPTGVGISGDAVARRVIVGDVNVPQTQSIFGNIYNGYIMGFTSNSPSLAGNYLSTIAAHNYYLPSNGVVIFSNTSPTLPAVQARS